MRVRANWGRGVINIVHLYPLDIALQQNKKDIQNGIHKEKAP